MAAFNIRPAQLDDTEAISQLFRAQVRVWQRLDAHGHVEEPPYAALSIYERWLHGGPWMSVETAAIFLSHLLTGAGIPLVAEVDGVILGYAEVYPGDEMQPFGHHLHLAHLLADADDIRDLMMAHLIDLASKQGGRLTVSISSYDQDTARLYQRYGFSPFQQVKQYALPSQTGQGFYQATDHAHPAREQIVGWNMLLGRTESARQHWDALWPPLWDALPEVTARQTHRLKFNVSGQDAFVCFQQQLYMPRTADVYCWSQKPFSAGLSVAIRDWAYRQGFRSLNCTLGENDARVISGDAEATPYQHDIYAIDVER